nr:uncharacterized protein LOC109190215 isoform X1 [Ipomoea trifida]
MCFSSQFTDHRCAIELPPPSGGRNSIPVSPPCANRSLPLSIVKMESACETKPSPTVVKLKPIEAPLETFRFEKVPHNPFQNAAVLAAGVHANRRLVVASYQRGKRRREGSRRRFIAVVVFHSSEFFRKWWENKLVLWWGLVVIFFFVGGVAGLERRVGREAIGANLRAETLRANFEKFSGERSGRFFNQRSGIFKLYAKVVQNPSEGIHYHSSVSFASL